MTLNKITITDATKHIQNSANHNGVNTLKVKRILSLKININNI